MRQRRFGNTDLSVSEVGFGCARLGGVFDGGTKTEYLRTLRASFDAGITFFDTADMYTQGESERLLGDAFARDRDRIVIASKAGYRLPAQKRAIGSIKPLLRPVIRWMGIKRENIPSGFKGSITQDFSAQYLTSCVEGSLRRLRTDYLDLFQLHSPPASVLEQGTFLSTLEKLKQAGKIRYYGVSCETTHDAEICLRYPQISALQIRLNLLEQTAIADVLPRASAHGIALIARECFAGGMLAKPYKDLPASQLSPQLDAYRRLAGELGCSLPALAVRFVQGLSPISITLLGMRTLEHLHHNLQYLEPPLSPAELSSLREVMEPAAVRSAG